MKVNVMELKVGDRFLHTTKQVWEVLSPQDPLVTEDPELEFIRKSVTMVAWAKTVPPLIPHYLARHDRDKAFYFSRDCEVEPLPLTTALNRIES